MLLTVDIGNTNILFGVFKEDKLVTTFRFASDSRRTAEQYCIELNNIALFKNFDIKAIDGIIISSVVPGVTPLIKDSLFMLTGVSAMIVGPGLKSGLKIKIDDPTQLGADLVASAVGALCRYSLPCLVVDLGTATKISVLDSKGNFRGCSISAGIGISLHALAGSAALLPHINLSVNDCSAFGTNTTASMQSGIIIGTASMIDGMCDRIEGSLGESIKSIVATGGYAQNIVKHCSHIIDLDPELILYGLKCIYNKNK